MYAMYVCIYIIEYEIVMYICIYRDNTTISRAQRSAPELVA